MVLQAELTCRGRHRRRLWVRTAMPSVLTEVSFLTNRDDATLLRAQDYRQQIAEALYAGIMK